MLELLLVIVLFRKLKARTTAKNRSKWLPWIAPLFWFGGEFMGAFIASIIYLILGKPVDNDLLVYGYALLGGILGAGLAFLIVHLLPVKKLQCPKCGWQFTKISRFGVDCGQCQTKLQIMDGVVSVVNLRQ